MRHILLNWCWFWTEWLFFYSVVVVRSSAVSFTLKEAEFWVSTLLHHQHCSNFYVSKCIPPMFFIAYFLQQNLNVLLRFFPVNCMSRWDTWTYFHCGVTLSSKWPQVNQRQASIAQRCVQVAIIPLIFQCYFSTIFHHPLSNTLLCLTASSYKMIPIHLFWCLCVLHR